MTPVTQKDRQMKDLKNTPAAMLDDRYEVTTINRPATCLLVALPAAALILLAGVGYALATPWTIDRGDGVHVPNPSCSSAACHDTGIPDKPSAPEKPEPPHATKPERSTPTAPHVEQAWTGTCCLDPDRNVIKVHTAFGHSVELAAKQCRAKLKLTPNVCAVQP